MKTISTLRCAGTARHTKRLVVKIAAVALAWLAVMLPAAAPANAQSLAPSSGTAASTQGIFDSTCSGAPSTKIVKIYTNSNDLSVILRCGTSTWGYRHIDARRADGFNKEIDDSIEVTLMFGSRTSRGTSVVYFFHGFRVVYEQNSSMTEYNRESSQPTCKSPEPTSLLMMADYSADPMWVRAPDGRAMQMVKLDDLALSSGLKDRLRQWARRYDELARTDYNWPSEEIRESWVAAGRVLYEEVCVELGPSFDVQYFHDRAGLT